jgi:hypothetical protein
MLTWVMRSRTGSHRDDNTPLSKCKPRIFHAASFFLSSFYCAPFFPLNFPRSPAALFEFRGKAEREKGQKEISCQNEYGKAQTTDPTANRRPMSPNESGRKACLISCSHDQGIPISNSSYPSSSPFFICFFFTCPP